VATEAYEVGTHSPHVNIVFRVGCMRNIAVLMQEFGSAGRNDNASDGFLMVNEYKDDQRLVFWTKSCSAQELQKKKNDYEVAWKWIFGVHTGLCMRQSLLKHFEDTDVIERPNTGECCSSCDLPGERNFDIKDTAFLLLKSIKELKNIPSIKDVSEDKLISWVRGARRDWLSKEEVQTYIDNSQTYGKGLFKDKKCLSKEWWSAHFRQLMHLDLIDVNFKIIRAPSFCKTTRTYSVSSRGDQFLQEPSSIYILPPLITSIQKNDKEKSQKQSNNTEGEHHLSKIRELLKNSTNWYKLSSKEEYEFPGFKTNDDAKLGYCDNIKKSHSFSSSKRPHYMWDDCQLTRRNTSTQAVDISIEGTLTKVIVRRAVCEGVKRCSAAKSDLVKRR